MHCMFKIMYNYLKAKIVSFNNEISLFTCLTIKKVIMIDIIHHKLIER